MIPRIAAGTLAGVCLQPLYSRYVFMTYPLTRYAWLGLIPPLLLAVCVALFCELTARAFPGGRRARPFYQNTFALSLGVSFFMHAWAIKVVWEAHPVLAAGVVATATLTSFALSAVWLRWRQLEQLAQATAPVASSPRRPEPRRKALPIVGAGHPQRGRKPARRALPPGRGGSHAAKDHRQPRARDARKVRRNAAQRLARKNGKGDSFLGLRADSPIFQSAERCANAAGVQRSPKHPR